MSDLVKQLRDQASWYTQLGSSARDVSDGGMFSAAADELERLRDENAKLWNDAERYRWLRDIGDATWAPMSKRGITASECDAAIDAAMREGK